MRSYGRGSHTAVDPYARNAPDEDGDVCCLACGGVFGDLDALRAAGLAAYPEKCRPCRAEERAARDAVFEGAPPTWGGIKSWAHRPASAR